MQLSFLGLGVMGYPMAGHLFRHGQTMTVYNRTPGKARRWVYEYGGQAAGSAAQAVADANIVLCCLGRDEDVRDVILSPRGALAEMRAGSLLIDHTTTSAGLARELAAACRARDVGFVDAPVSGGQVGAEAGTLTVMAGGQQADYQRASEVFSCYARCHRLLGPAGHGQLAKMVNQICLAGTLQGLSEALNFARVSGLDAEAVVDVIRQGAAQSWQMDNLASTMLLDKFDFGFAVEWMRKDLGYALSEADAHGCPLPVTAMVDEFYAQIETMGGKRWDTSSLIRRL